MTLRKLLMFLCLSYLLFEMGSDDDHFSAFWLKSSEMGNGDKNLLRRQ